MKTDVLTLAALVFIVGLLMSTVSFSSMFDSEEENIQLSAQQTASAQRLP